MSTKSLGRNWAKLLLTAISILVSYYLAVILHEWGHGTVAWLYGYKEMFFDVDYGGWLLLHVDEGVPYPQILAAKQGTAAALIGIAGTATSTILLLLSFCVLKRVKRRVLLYSFFYWFSILNMVPVIQYFTVQTFSSTGDVGRFTHGLNISPWWVFIPGVIFVYFALYTLLGRFVPKAYALVAIKTLWGRRIFLLLSLGIMFLLIYAGGYNPLSDREMPPMSKILVATSIAFVPILFFLCDPSRKWVKEAATQYMRLAAGRK